MSNTGKSYDDRYFDQWYRQTKLSSPARLRRKVALAVSQAEYYLERPIRSVLDIGCGEGAWRKPLLRLRRHIHYLGFDSSHYAVNRYGLQRNLHIAQIGDFSWLRPCAPVDLLVCADVLHYVATRELTRALPGFVELCNGVAFLEIFTAEDAFRRRHDRLSVTPSTLVSAPFHRSRIHRTWLTLLAVTCARRAYNSIGAQLKGCPLPHTVQSMSEISYCP